MAQLSENALLWPVFTDLLDPEGVEIYFKPVSFYIEQGTQTTYRDLVLAAASKGEVALGYRAPTESTHGGVHLNPNQDITFAVGSEDSLIVLAEEAFT